MTGRTVVEWLGGEEGQERGITKRQGEMFQDDGYVPYLDCGDGFIDVYMCHTYNFVYFK